MALALEYFFCCLDLKLGGIIMAWWGMVISAISIVSCVLALIAGDRGGYTNYLPFHVITSNGLISGLLTLLILVIYFYFSYQLLLGAQSVSFKFQSVNHQIYFCDLRYFIIQDYDAMEILFLISTFVLFRETPHKWSDISSFMA